MREFHKELADTATDEEILGCMEWGVVKMCRSAFERSVSEAVYIQLGFDGPDVMMNSKEEWGSYELPELTVKERQSKRDYLARELNKGRVDVTLGEGEELEEENGRGRGKRGAQTLSSASASKRRRKMRGTNRGVRAVRNEGCVSVTPSNAKRKKEVVSPEISGEGRKRCNTSNKIPQEI